MRRCQNPDRLQNLSQNPPSGAGRRFAAAPGAALPDAVGRVVPDGSQNLGKLPGPVIQVQRTDPGQVGPQVPMDPRTLDADQST